MGLKEALAQVADLLFLPVLILLILLVGWMLVSIGLFLRALVGRARGARPAQARYRTLIDGAVEGDPALLDIRIEEIVQRAENDAARMLNSVRFAIRAGPSLGLMGTLIPMATALSGLAGGDLPGLASNMVVAFSSTVVGIAVGLVAYVIAMVREGWTRADLDAVRFHAERVLRAHGAES